MAESVRRYRTDAIVAVLEASRGEMSIEDVIAGLADLGRPDETADNVRVDLACLAERDRVRVRRGAAHIRRRPARQAARQHGSAAPNVARAVDHSSVGSKEEAK